MTKKNWHKRVKLDVEYLNELMGRIGDVCRFSRAVEARAVLSEVARVERAARRLGLSQDPRHFAPWSESARVAWLVSLVLHRAGFIRSMLEFMEEDP